MRRTLLGIAAAALAFFLTRAGWGALQELRGSALAIVLLFGAVSFLYFMRPPEERRRLGNLFLGLCLCVFGGSALASAWRNAEHPALALALVACAIALLAGGAVSFFKRT